MAFELWSTQELMEVVYADDAAPPDGFWLANFFNREYRSEAEKIYFDQIVPRDRRLAPFVVPQAQGRVMSGRPSTLASFAPAYVKPKHEVDPQKVVTRRRGEPLNGLQTGAAMSMQARFDMAVADNLMHEMELIARTEDWMASQAVAYGQVIIAGEDYPSTTVSFGRHSSLDYTPGTAWDGVSPDPLADIQLMRNRAFPLGRAGINRLIFGSDAWGAFIENTEVKALLDNMKRGSNSNFDTTGLTDGSPLEYVGYLEGGTGGGRLDLYKYFNEYENLDGTLVPYIDPGHVVGTGNAIGGVRAYGAIKDVGSLQAVPRFPKMWPVEDPSAIFTMTQSAPMMVPTNPNNSFVIRAL